MEIAESFCQPVLTVSTSSVSWYTTFANRQFIWFRRCCVGLVLSPLHLILPRRCLLHLTLRLLSRANGGGLSIENRTKGMRTFDPDTPSQLRYRPFVLIFILDFSFIFSSTTRRPL